MNKHLSMNLRLLAKFKVSQTKQNSFSTVSYQHYHIVDNVSTLTNSCPIKICLLNSNRSLSGCTSNT